MTQTAVIERINKVIPNINERNQEKLADFAEDLMKKEEQWEKDKLLIPEENREFFKKWNEACEDLDEEYFEVMESVLKDSRRCTPPKKF